MLTRMIILTLLLSLGCTAKPAITPTSTPTPVPERVEIDLKTILSLAQGSDPGFKAALQYIGDSWSDGLAVVLLELGPMSKPGRLQAMLAVTRSRTGQNFQNLNEWFAWYWNQPERPPSWYPEFKAQLYSHIDPSFKEYFDNNPEMLIDLTEVRWGGVRRDGIPPLDHPEMIGAADASYLADDNVVFGIVHNGDARAYPKRILAWHEMFRDHIGGDSIAGVYCTLCGTMIPYLAQEHVLGTSGFLYRSNKLMYDMKTRSLWSTTDGTPVIGPLVGRNIDLESLPVVTTTWGEWRRRHPQTTVLSLNTGHKRDYGEGVAYKEYFATDRLMFNTPKLDTRLPNKAEVLVFGASQPALAISAEFLLKNKLYHGENQGKRFVVLTDSSGANRVYDARDQKFSDYAKDVVKDSQGSRWQVLPERLLGPQGESLPRVPAHRAFWFGWYAAHPETRLVK